MLNKILAFFRLSQKAICEESAGKDEWTDYHDYPDDNNHPSHFYLYRCKHCGKGFYI